MEKIKESLDKDDGEGYRKWIYDWINRKNGRFRKKNGDGRKKWSYLERDFIRSSRREEWKIERGCYRNCDNLIKNVGINSEKDVDLGKEIRKSKRKGRLRNKWWIEERVEDRSIWDCN